MLGRVTHDDGRHDDGRHDDGHDGRMVVVYRISGVARILLRVLEGHSGLK